MFSVLFFLGDLFRFRCVRVGSSIRRNKVFSENAAVYGIATCYSFSVH